MLAGKYFVLLLFMMSLVGCARIDLHEEGKIYLSTDWSEKMDGIHLDGRYMVLIGSDTLYFNGLKNELPSYYPGSYSMYIYNPVLGITIKDGLATVAQESGMLLPSPGWLFSAYVDIQIENDSEREVEVKVQQQVRELTLVLKPTGGTKDRIKNIQAKLSGVAGQWDLKSNSAKGNGMEVPLQFNKQSNGDWTAIVRLLGCVGTSQMLSGSVSFQDGIPENLIISSDLSSSMKDFNQQKHVPLQLQAGFETQTAVGFEVSIRDWVVVNESGTAW